jgi:RNA recognition motif-containing protein
VKALYVGNLPLRASEEDLRKWFRQEGFGVDKVDIIRDRYTGESRGFGFVEIGDDEEAVRAMLILNSKEFLGRALVVSEARSPRPGGARRSKGGRREW